LDKNSNDEKFDKILLEAVDEAFAVLGESVKTAIYFHLEHKFFIAKQEIPHRIDDFSDALERIFNVGARNLEILVMKKLNERISCSYEWNGPSWLIPDLTFSQYIELARLHHEDKRKIADLEVIIDAEQKQEIQV
jgi:ribosomal protein L23